MITGNFTTANILKGVAALTAAGVVTGVVLTVLNETPDEPSLNDIVEQRRLDVVPEGVEAGYSLGKTSTDAAVATEESPVCPDIMKNRDAAKYWPEACGTGRPPYYESGTSLVGHWDIEAPGNPFLEELLVVINRSHGGVGWRDGDAPLMAVTMEREKGETWYAPGGTSLSVADDGTITFDYGQYAFCNCASITFVTRPTGDPNVMTGTWVYDKLNMRGITVWRRRSPAKIHTISYRNRGADPAETFTRDEVAYGLRPLRIEQRLSLIDKMWLTITGENFAGGHNVWIDPASHIELRYGEAGWLCADGSRRDYGTDWVHCGSTNAAGDGVVGLSLGLVFWEGIAPGRQTLWVDGQAIPFEMTIEGYPEEDQTPKPELAALNSYDTDRNELSQVDEGLPFVLQATFESEHPDQWVRLDMQPYSSVPDSEAETLSQQSVTLTRTEDHRIFRSQQLLLEPEHRENDQTGGGTE